MPKGNPLTPNNAFCVDVEDWFHLVGAGLSYQFVNADFAKTAWSNFSPRVEKNTGWLLDLLDRHNTRATFFVLGWIADHHPELIKKIADRGHEIASHGYWHKVLSAQSPEEFREDLCRSVNAISNVTGLPVQGYRASSASITSWALDIISESGLTYDSSYYPASLHDVYGRIAGLDSDKPIEKLPNGLWEVKFSSLRIGRYYLPWSGGGYFRLFPFPLFSWGARKIERSQGTYVFFVHPWEVDTAPPLLPGLKAAYRIRRHIGIQATRTKLERLLDTMSFTTITEVLNGWQKKYL